jgi:hypothetical protein
MTTTKKTKGGPEPESRKKNTGVKVGDLSSVELRKWIKNVDKLIKKYEEEAKKWE